jgi:parvulin-like peptidyl-prolyl isomerase
MKKILGIVFCVLLVYSAAGRASFALDAQKPAAAGEGAGTKKASEGATITLKVPLSSPLFSQFPVAVVNDDPVSVADLLQALGAVHEGRGNEKTKTEATDYKEVLDRIINARLISQEAANIGLDQLPEVKDAVEKNGRAALADLVRDDISKNVKADPSEVEARLKKMVEEWKIVSVLFEKEDDAKAMSDAIKAGKPFGELAKKAVKDKKAKGGGEGEYMKPRTLLPEIESAGSALEVGAVSPVIKLGSGKNQGFAIIKLLDKRYPETPEARMQAEQAVLANKKFEAINKYKKVLFSKYVTIKDRRVDGLDYDSPKANLEKLFTDTRVVAEIKDGDPVTVGDLTQALGEKFYHGLKEAAKGKKLNGAKREALNVVIERRLVRSEAVRRGLDKSEEYRIMMRDINNTLLFGMFIKKVVAPDIIVHDEDLQAYFRDHKKEYTFPEMMKLSVLTFGKKRDAGAALTKLKRGDDFNWVRANADGLVATDDEGMQLDGRVLATSSMPKEVRAAVAGAREGDFRLSPGPNGSYYVLSIQEVIPPRLQAFEEVKKEIQNKVLEVKMNEAVKDWFSKLRAASEIKVYLSQTNN